MSELVSLIGGHGFKTDLRKDAIGGDFGGDHGGFGLLRWSCKLSKTLVYAVQFAPDMGNLGVVFCSTLPDQLPYLATAASRCASRASNSRAKCR